jgi:hypothetical protein
LNFKWKKKRVRTELGLPNLDSMILNVGAQAITVAIGLEELLGGV